MPPEQWNNAKGKAKGSSQEAKSFNNYLDDIRIKLNECYRELQLKQEKITPDGIKSLFLGDNTDQHTINELIEYHNLSQFRLLSSDHKTIGSSKTPS
jgi:hypothetical protein